MKALFVLALAGLSFAASAQHYKASRVPRASSYGSPVHVNGYVKKSGTYVMPHYQTAPDKTKVNNWSSKPNVNPMTGKPGTKDPFAPGH